MILPSASPVSLGFTVLAALAYAWPALRASHIGSTTARWWVGIAWLAHAGALSIGLLTEPLRFGFAPAISVTAWLIAAIYAVESYVYPQLPTRWALSALATAAVVLALLFPGATMASTASAWLPWHLAMGIACYGLFGVAVVHAWFMARAEVRMRLAADTHSGLPLLTLERLTYHFVTAGYFLLSATLLGGYLFGDVLYGQASAWRWDHKTVFSVLSWFTFTVLLVGRSYFGWRGKRALTLLYTGSTFLLLAYIGSRFVTEVVLGRSA
jgi:ABC-type uncharacterized transport system permease subunit